MESIPLPTVSKRLWHIVRAVFYMLRKGISKRKLMMDLHLLLKRGKIAGKALGHFISFHHHHQHHHHPSTSATHDRNFSAWSCRSLDPNTLFYDPKEIQLSCSNTPSYFYSYAARKHKGRRYRREDSYDSYDAVAVAMAIEMLDRDTSDTESMVLSALPTPSPMLVIGMSPIGRKLRITDSPFPVHEEDVADKGRIDKDADEFIKKFYEQLRRQQMALAATTPKYAGRQTVPGWA